VREKIAMTGNYGPDVVHSTTSGIRRPRDCGTCFADRPRRGGHPTTAFERARRGAGRKKTHWRWWPAARGELDYAQLKRATRHARLAGHGASRCRGRRSRGVAKCARHRVEFVPPSLAILAWVRSRCDGHAAPAGPGRSPTSCSHSGATTGKKLVQIRWRHGLQGPTDAAAAGGAALSVGAGAADSELERLTEGARRRCNRAPEEAGWFGRGCCDPLHIGTTGGPRAPPLDAASTSCILADLRAQHADRPRRGLGFCAHADWRFFAGAAT
jgi:hypothetical protein